MAAIDERNANKILYQKDYSFLKSLSEENSKDFSLEAHAIFKKHVNPYEFMLVSLSLTSVKESQTKNPFLLRTASEFQNFIEINSNLQKYSKLLTSSIQSEIFGILKKFKDNDIQNAFIKCFSLGSAPHILVPLLLEDLEKDNVKNAINLIKQLEFGSHFDAKDLLIPLLLHNKIGIIEEFLKCDNSYCVIFLKILDQLVGNELQISDLLLDYNIRRIKNLECLKPKSIFKLGLRLMKKFGVPSATFPNIIIRHNKSSLRYLFSRHYMENGITLESLLLFAKELAEKNDMLKKEVLDLFVDYYDYETALLYLKDVQVQEKDIPQQLLDYQASNENHTLSARNIKKDKQTNYYQLNLPLKCVVTVDTIEHFEQAVNHLSTCDIISMDTEWKPSHQFDEDEKLSLFQLASNDKIYIFDMINLPPILSEEHWNRLGKLLSDESVTKLSYAFAGDKKHLGAINKYLKEHLNMMKNSIDLDNTKVALLECHPNIYSYKNVEHKGLSELVFLCFGKPLNKIEQCSYWAARPLSTGQLVYSALDAYCLIEICRYLDEKSKELNIADWKYLRPSEAGRKRQNNSQNHQVSAQRKSPKGPEFSRQIKSVYASDFKVVCDTMLQGLGKLLRFCNIDTVILKPEDSHDKCTEFFEEQRRIVLTKGNVFHRLRKYVPESHIYVVKNAVPKMQLQELVSRFQIVISENDVFARCGTCNSNEYLYLEPAIVSKMKNNFSSNHASSNSLTRSQWINVDGGKIDIGKGLTDKDILIQHADIPFPILNIVNVIYVCSGCGKCYWDGSHMDRFLKDISNVLKKSYAPYVTVPVPPPQNV